MEKSLTPKDIQISGKFQTLISRRPFVFFHVFWPSCFESYSKLKMYFMNSPYIIYTWKSIKRLGIFPFRLVYLWKRVQFFFNKYLCNMYNFIMEVYGRALIPISDLHSLVEEAFYNLYQNSENKKMMSLFYQNIKK